MRKRYFPILMLAAIMVCKGLSAQTARQVLIVNSGVFDPTPGAKKDYLTVGLYNTGSKTYSLIDSAKANSAGSAIIEDKYAYVAADSTLLKIDVDQKKRVATGHSTGMNSPGGYLAVYNSYLLVTRGYPATSGYVQIFNKADLSLVTTITGVPDESAGIVVVGDSAYVAVPGAYPSTKGYLSVIDLKNLKLKRSLDLGGSGANIGRMFTDGQYIYLYSPDQKKFITYNTSTGTYSAVTSPGIFSGGTSLAGDTLYTDVNYAGIYKYNVKQQLLESKPLIDYSRLKGYPAASAYDPTARHLYVTSSDFATYGWMYIIGQNAKVLDSFKVGVSPEVIALDYHVNAGIEEEAVALGMTVYPNPASGHLFVSLSAQGESRVSLVDMSGRLLEEKTVTGGLASLDVTGYANGIYLVKVWNGEKMAVRKVVVSD